MAKTDFLTADMTRRQFMKISGRSLAGLTLSASMLSLFGCSQQQVDSGAVATWALPQGLLVVNADLCTGCQRCEINCPLTNDGVTRSFPTGIPFLYSSEGICPTSQTYLTKTPASFKDVTT